MYIGRVKMLLSVKNTKYGRLEKGICRCAEGLFGLKIVKLYSKVMKGNQYIYKYHSFE